MVRFVHLINYAEGVSREDAEKWYLGEHVPQVQKLPGIQRYRSWPAIEPPPISYPNAGVPTPFDQFVRRTELCFDSLEAGLGALKADPSLWSPSQKGVPGFREFECMFLDEEPQYDLLRDAPPQHYKYMTQPMQWPNGKPEIDDTAAIFIDSYCLAYRPDVSIEDGEDWYLGHHTREGKQLPGMKHYRTWKTIHVPEEPSPDLRLNKWFRLTELGMSPAAYRATMVDKETRVSFAPSPLGNVLGAWMNIAINPENPQDLLK